MKRALLLALALISPTRAVNGGSDTLPTFQWTKCQTTPLTYCGDIYLCAAIAKESWYYYNLTVPGTTDIWGKRWPTPIPFPSDTKNVDPNGASIFLYSYSQTPPTVGVNGCTPGYTPIIRVEPGVRYNLTFHNAAAKYPMYFPSGDVLKQLGLLGVDNIWKVVDRNLYPTHTTNLHIHGIHESGAGDHDNVFRVLEPGQCQTYVYNVLPDVPGGVHWYHPHFHGKVVFQVFGGAYGFWLTEDKSENLKNRATPKAATDSQVLKFFTNKLIERHLLAYNGFNLWLGNGNPEGASISLIAGQWHRLRVLFVNPEALVQWAQFTNFYQTTCNIVELAFDGVPSSPLPYDKPAYAGAKAGEFKYAVHGAERVEFGIKCTTVGRFLLRYGVVDPSVNLGIVGRFTVVAGTPDNATPYWGGKSWNLVRPPYYADVYQPTLDQIQKTAIDAKKLVNTYDVTITLSGINGMKFLSRLPPNPVKPLITQQFGPGYVHSIRLIGSGAHPTHMHQNHMQIAQSNGCGPAMKPYQWYDTVSYLWPGTDVLTNGSVIPDSGVYDHKYDCLVRYRQMTYCGVNVMHCHILDHEDSGLVAFYDVPCIPGSGAFELSKNFSNGVHKLYDCCKPLSDAKGRLCYGNRTCTGSKGVDTCGSPCDLPAITCPTGKICALNVCTTPAAIKESHVCDAVEVPTAVTTHEDSPIYPWIIMGVAIAIAVIVVIGAFIVVKKKVSAYNTLLIDEIKMDRNMDRTFGTPATGFTPPVLELVPVPSCNTAHGV